MVFVSCGFCCGSDILNGWKKKMSLPVNQICGDCYWFEPKRKNEDGLMMEDWCRKIKRHRCARSKQANVCKFYKQNENIK